MNETVGERIKRLRLDAGLSQRDLGQRGASFAYICRIEAGTRNPSVRALRKLAGVLGVTAPYLETGRDTLALAERALDLELTNLARLAIRRARREETAGV